MIEKILYQDWHSLPASLHSIDTLATLLLSFFGITWAFSQIIFPRLRKLDEIQDEIFAEDIPEDDIHDRNHTNVKDKIEESIGRLEKLFLRYEATYKTVKRLAINASTIFILFTASLVWVTSGSNYVLTFLYLLLTTLTVILILISYPTPNKLRNIEFLASHFGFNPKMLLMMMQPSIIVHADAFAPNIGLQKTDLVLGQELFLTGWSYYLEVADDNKKVFYVTNGRVNFGRGMIRNYSQYGTHNFFSLGAFHSQPNTEEATVVLTMLVFAPLLHLEKAPYKHIDQYHPPVGGNQYDTAFLPHLTVGRMASDRSVVVSGKLKNYKISLNEEESSVNRTVLGRILSYMNLGAHVNINTPDGNMLNLFSKRWFKPLMLLPYWYIPVIHRRPFVYLGEDEAIKKEENG